MRSSGIHLRVKFTSILKIIQDCKKLNHLDGLVQERRNSIANALELRLSYTNPSILSYMYQQLFYYMFLLIAIIYAVNSRYIQKVMSGCGYTERAD